MRLKEMLMNNAFTQLLIRIFKHFDTVPHAIKVEHYSFYIISNIGYTVGWLIHAIWFFIFLWISSMAFNRSLFNMTF